MRKAGRHGKAMGTLFSAILTLGLLAFAGSSQAAEGISTGEIVTSTLSPSCMDWQVIGLCFWLECAPKCKVKTSIKVKHYIPEVVVSGYTTTGENPWTDVSVMGTPVAGAEGGGNAITPGKKRDNLPRFKNADAIGHPGGSMLGMIGGGYVCQSATTPVVPYFLSTLDTVAWRFGLPEQVYPEALIPGRREIGSLGSNNWGSVYPRQGFLVQSDDGKAGAVIAQRTADIITRSGQPHVYLGITAKTNEQKGWWPPQEPVMEGDEATHKWQALYPKMENSCSVFPTGIQTMQSETGGYAWALWRPYRCCKKAGQVFLYSVGN